jgi:peptidoglycan-N-acetylglucosamine deacetylase
MTRGWGAQVVRAVIGGCVMAACVIAAGVGATDSATHGRRDEASIRSVAFTVDDLPGAWPGSDRNTGNLKDLERINEAIPSILRAHHVPAIGFVNEKKLQVSGERDARVKLLQRWIDAGIPLGNHTYSHASFQRTPLEEFEDETIRGEVVTRALMEAAGMRETYFRHPFLETGPTAEAKAAFEEFLAKRGYRVAPVTIDNSDWMLNDVYVSALAKHDGKLAKKTKDTFFEYEDASWAYFEGVAQKLFGRNIAQIFLMHDNAINAETLDAFLTRLEKRGYKFVTLDEALKDPAYATPDKFIGAEGISWLTRWKLAFGQRADYENDPDPPKWVIELSNKLRKSNGE